MEARRRFMVLQQNFYNHRGIGGRTFTVKIYGQGTTSAPGTLLRTQAATLALGWNTMTLSTPLTVSGEDLWIGYSVSNAAGEYPGGVDAGPAAANGDWIYLNSSWEHLAGLGLNYNWNIRAIIAGGTDGMAKEVLLDDKGITLKA